MFEWELPHFDELEFPLSFGEMKIRKLNKLTPNCFQFLLLVLSNIVKNWVTVMNLSLKVYSIQLGFNYKHTRKAYLL